MLDAADFDIEGSFANLGVADDSGAFVYFDESLQINRLVYASDVEDSTADIFILGKINTLFGDYALDTSPEFYKANFVFQSKNSHDYSQ